MTALRSSTARGRELIGHVLEEVEPFLRRWIDDAGEMNGRSSRAGPHRGHEVLRSRVASRRECDGADDELLRAAAHGRDERAGSNLGSSGARPASRRLEYTIVEGGVERVDAA